MQAGKWQQKRRRVLKLLTTMAVGTMLLAGWTNSTEAATPYTTSEGDTFWKLSQRYDIPLKKLMSFNPHVDAHNVYAGLKLMLPASSTAAGVKAQLAVAAQQAAAAKQRTSAAQPAAAKLMAAESAVTAAKSAKTEAPASYKKSFQAKASAYTAAHEENGWGPIDYFGNPLKVGTVAVDPKVVPLGSKLFITGYDYAGLPVGGMHATATDTGSAIKGKRIDIFVPDSRKEAMNFGFQYVTVYVY